MELGIWCSGFQMKAVSIDRSLSGEPNLYTVLYYNYTILYTVYYPILYYTVATYILDTYINHQSTWSWVVTGVVRSGCHAKLSRTHLQLPELAV